LRASARRQKVADLGFAKRWLGIIGSKRVVFDAAADALQVARPATVKDGYAVLAQFHQTFRHSPAPRAPRHRPTATPLAALVSSDAFLASYEWRRLRMVVLTKRGARCECCGATPKDGIRIHVDHIQPRRKHPELALTESNLQVLCEVCNHGKGSWDTTDWRAASHTSGESSANSPVPRSGDGDEHDAQRDGLRPPRQGRDPVPRLVKRRASA